MVRQKNYYSVLGVDEKAGFDEIKNKYRKLAKQYHPDKNRGNKQAEDKFKEISEAYYVLSDAARKKAYDEQRAAPAGSFSGAEDIDWEAFLRNINHGAGEGESPFEEIFGWRRGRSPGGYYRTEYEEADAEEEVPRKVQTDVSLDAEISPEQAAAGGKVLIKRFDGKSISVTIPRNIKSGQVLRIPREGRRCPCCDKNGDLLMRIKIHK